MKDKKSKKVLRGQKAGILLEDLDSKLDLIVEKVESTERRLSEQMVEMKAELKQDIADIHLTLRNHGSTLQKHEEEISILKHSSHH